MAQGGLKLFGVTCCHLACCTCGHCASLESSLCKPPPRRSRSCSQVGWKRDHSRSLARIAGPCRQRG
eukprot:6964568-Alexandrium_andersonii.AAC.1